MKIALWINRVLLTLLSISTGAVKLAKMEEEMHIFRVAGWSDALTIAFGVVQLLGAISLLVRRLTVKVAVLMAFTFFVATGVLFINGMVTFGLFSVLFIVSAVVHARYWPRLMHSP